MNIRIVVKEPMKAPECREIEYNDYQDLAKIIAIGNYNLLEAVGDCPPGLDLYANEEGKYASDVDGHYPEANLSIFGGQDYVMGTVFVSAADSEGETRSLEDAEVDIATEWLKQHAVSIIGAARARAMADMYR